jgi:hypothetical protein
MEVVTKKKISNMKEMSAVELVFSPGIFLFLPILLLVFY